MKVFVAGASGALGRQLVRKLVAAGHDVVGTTTSEAKRELVYELGARPVVLDILDREAVIDAVADAGPDAIVHQATALSGDLDFRHIDRAFAPTNRLRTDGTDNLLAAARESGVKRFVAQSFAGWPAARSGPMVKTEEDDFDPSPPEALREMMAAIRHLEEAVTGAGFVEGIALRYGGFYGPGTSLSGDGGYHVDAIKGRKFPIVGSGAGVWSFIHVEDAAEATVAAVERGERGVYNIVDDEPAAVAEWLPEIAAALGAKPPRRVPRFVGRLFAGEAGAIMMTEVRGASNAKAKRELGWQPARTSWRTGLADELSGNGRERVLEAA
jgi:nucleoside-diphosphate-sugar epimerase